MAGKHRQAGTVLRRSLSRVRNSCLTKLLEDGNGHWGKRARSEAAAEIVCEICREPVLNKDIEDLYPEGRCLTVGIVFHCHHRVLH